jgi:hypothetical protein
MKGIELTFKISNESTLFNARMSLAKNDEQKTKIIEEYHSNIDKIIKEERTIHEKPI